MTTNSGIAEMEAPARTPSPGRRSASETPRDGLTPVGDQLRAERQRLGVELEQVAESTKIRKDHLQALERRDWDALPADVFTRGYLRTYAEYLGLDAEHLLRAYARERRIAGVEDPSASGPNEGEVSRAILERLGRTQGVEPPRFGSRTKRIVLVLAGVGVGAAALWTAFHLPVTGQDGRAAIEAPAPAEHRSAVPQPPPDAVGGDNAAPQAAPTEGRGPQTPSVGPTDETRAPAELVGASHLTVPESGVGTEVVGHRLVGQGDRFQEGTVVWFWTSVLGGRPGDKIQHVWLRGGRTIAVGHLHVGNAHWRTQSWRRLPKGSAGDWTVEARDPQGHVLASAAFTCVAAD